MLTARPITTVLRSSRMIASRSMSAKVPLLLSPAEFKELPQSTTIPVDCSWHMPNSTRSAVAEYLSGPRIPNARRFDLDEVAELAPETNPLSLSHMMPTVERFAEECRKLGINEEDHVVLYDTVGVFSSPRGLFTFKAFGHEKVSILNGGLPRWIDEGNEVEMGELQDVGQSEYKGKPLDSAKLRSYEEMVKNSQQQKGEGETVLDHRPLARFTGEAPEPRPGMPSGHIPNSLPLPFSSYLEPHKDKQPYSTYKSIPELKTTLAQAVGGESKFAELEDKPVVFTCGSGMTAAVGWLADTVVRESEGKESRGVLYDESWTGWASRKESKIERGQPK